MVERAAKFLHQVVAGREAIGRGSLLPPNNDRHVALALLAEILYSERGWPVISSCQGMIAGLLWREPVQLWFPCSGDWEKWRGDPYQEDVDDDMVNPTSCFLDYLEMPEDEELSVD